MAGNSRDLEIVAYERSLPGFAAGTNAVHGACRAVAQRIPAWILARKTNEHSFPFVGQTGYAPKEISCKPKTADRNNPIPWARDVRIMQTAGLVVDPTICPHSFSSSAKLNEALDQWAKFAPKYLKEGAGYGYSVQKRLGTAHYGCLMRNHRYIHGDLDLFDVITPRAALSERRFQEKVHDNETNVFTALTRVAGNLINNTLHCEMVLHGAQMHYGGWDENGVLVFAPDGRCFELPFDQQPVWYSMRWPGRLPAGLKLLEHKGGV